MNEVEEDNKDWSGQGRKKSQDGDGVMSSSKSERSNPQEDGEGLHQTEGKSLVSSAEPPNDKCLEGSEPGLGAATVEKSHKDGGEELRQLEDDTLVASTEPTKDNPLEFTANPTEELSFKDWGVKEEKVLAAAIEAVEGGEEASLGSIQERLRKKSLAKSGESTEEKPSDGGEGEKRPNIEYFCPPNQYLTRDAWKIMFFHMLPFTTVPHLLTLACLGWAYHQWGWSALLFYTTLCALLTFSPLVYSRRFRAGVSDYFYGLLARYVPSAQYVVPEKPFPEHRPYIFACHPHGRMFFSTIIFSQRHSIWRRNILQTGDLFMTAASMFFVVPFLRNLFYLVGVIPAGKQDIIAKLRNKDHVTILIGGVKEVLLGTQDDVDMIYLTRRKGFCKIALQENAGVVPVYFFNENQMFMHNSKSFLRFWERVNRYFKVGVPFMRGRYLILPMPFRRSLLMAVGEPLFPEEGESVDGFHARYVRALRELFDKYVPYSPDPDHKLIIT